MSCSAVFCSSRTTKEGVKDPELSFHTFPKCPEIRREWIKAIRRDRWEPTKYARLCSKHFDTSCFITGLSLKKLKTDAIPTIFEEYLPYYQPVTKKRKSPQHRNEISPRKQEMLQEGICVQTDDVPTTSRRPVNLLNSLTRSRTVALRRLKTIKKLRENNRRLAKKNARLLNALNDLRRKKPYEYRVIRFVKFTGKIMVKH